MSTNSLTASSSPVLPRPLPRLPRAAIRRTRDALLRVNYMPRWYCRIHTQYQSTTSSLMTSLTSGTKQMKHPQPNPPDASTRKLHSAHPELCRQPAVNKQPLTRLTLCRLVRVSAVLTGLTLCRPVGMVLLVQAAGPLQPSLLLPPATLTWLVPSTHDSSDRPRSRPLPLAHVTLQWNVLQGSAPRELLSPKVILLHGDSAESNQVYPVHHPVYLVHPQLLQDGPQ